MLLFLMPMFREPDEIKSPRLYLKLVSCEATKDRRPPLGWGADTDK
jgi:hypothetical protein